MNKKKLKTFKSVIEFRIFPHEKKHSRGTYGSFSIIFLFIRFCWD